MILIAKGCNETSTTWLNGSPIRQVHTGLVLGGRNSIPITSFYINSGPNHSSSNDDLPSTLIEGVRWYLQI